MNNINPIPTIIIIIYIEKEERENSKENWKEIRVAGTQIRICARFCKPCCARVADRIKVVQPWHAASKSSSSPLVTHPLVSTWATSCPIRADPSRNTTANFPHLTTPSPPASSSHHLFSPLPLFISSLYTNIVLLLTHRYICTRRRKEGRKTRFSRVQ